MALTLPKFQQDGTGAVNRDVGDKLKEFVSVKDFGAVGDGVADDTAAIQAAINYAASLSPNMPSIYIPPGDYIIASTVNISSGVEIFGDGFNTRGTRLFHGASLNAPMFDVTSGARFFSMSIIGTNNALNTSESSVRIVGTNNVTFDNVTFYRVYDGILIGGSTPSFYISIENCRFEDANNSFIKIDNTASAGVDLIIGHTRFVGNIVNTAFDFNNGLGSIIGSDLQISATGTKPGGQLVKFGTPATLYGGAQFSNCVFESEATGANGSPIYLQGTSLNKWKELHFDNCLFTGGSSPAAVFAFVNGAMFTNCTFSSSNTSGQVWFTAFGEIADVKMIGCRYESNSSAPVLYATGDCKIQGLYVVSPYWGGASRFVEFGSVSPGNLSLDILGGFIGLHATPINLNDYRNTIKKNIQAYGDNYGVAQKATYVGTLDGSGNANIAHGITTGHLKIIQAEAFYKGGFGEMIRMNVNTIDGTTIYLTAGVGGRKYRCTLIYQQMDDSNW